MWKKILVLAFVSLMSGFCHNHSTVKAQSFIPENYQLQLGDIVEFKNFSGDLYYGLVMKINRRDFEVRHYHKSFGLHTSRVSQRDTWKVFLTSDDLDGRTKPLSGYRKWKAKKGKSTTTARLMKIYKDKVVLKKRKGDDVTVPINKLSTPDQKYIAKLKEKHGLSEEPGKSRVLEKLPVVAMRIVEMRRKIKSGEIAIKGVANTNLVAVNMTVDEWELPSSAGKSLQIGDVKSIDIPCEKIVPGGKLEFYKFFTNKPFAYFLMKPSGGRSKTPSVLNIVDYKTGKELANHEFKPVKDFGDRFELLSVSPSGKRFVTLRGEDREYRLTFWAFDGEKITKKFDYQDEENVGSGTKIKLISDSRGVIVATRKLIFFNFDKKINLSHKAEPGDIKESFGKFLLSEDGRYLFVGGTFGRHLYAFDARDKELISRIEIGEDFRFDKLRFSSKQDRIVCEGFKNVAEVRVTDGEVISTREKKLGRQSIDGMSVGTHGEIRGYSIFHKQLGVNVGRVDFSGSFGSEVIDLEKGKRLVLSVAEKKKNRSDLFDEEFKKLSDSDLTENELNEIEKRIDERLKVLERTGRTGDIEPGSIKIQYEVFPLEEIGRKVDAITEKDMIDFKRGSTVSLHFQLENFGHAEENLRRKIVSDFQRGGIRVVEGNAEFQLHLTYREGRVQKRNYRVIGGPGGIVERTESIIPKTASARLMQGKTAVWSRGGSANLNGIRTVQELEDQLSRAKTVSVGLLSSWEYPTKIRRLKRGVSFKAGWEKR